MNVERFFDRPVRTPSVLAVSLLILIARAVVGVVFIAAAYHKVMDPECFAEQVKNYDMLPYGLLAPFSLFLPWLELWVGLFLILGLWTRPAAFLTQGMLVVFLAALGYAVSRDLNIECGCFSAEGGSKAGWKRIWEDIYLFAGTLIPLILGSGKLGLDRLLRRASRD